MTDLSKLSDDELKALYGQSKAVASMSDAQLKAAYEAAKKDEGGFLQGVGNLAAGAIRGAGSIGATLLAPIDMAKDAIDGKGLSMESNRQRRAEMDAGLQSMGAQPDSWMYRGGKLAGEIAGTAGAGGVLANGVRAVGATRAMAGLEPITNAVATGLETGGFRIGEMAGTGAAAGVTRLATGAASGAASAGLANPEDAGLGAVIGGALPGVVKGAGAVMDGTAAGVQKMAGTASPEVAALAQRAQELGIQIPADRLVDSRPLNAIASSLNYVPMSGRALTEDVMVSQLNRAVSRTFGQDSSNVTAALRKADDQLGGQFEKVLSENGVAFDKQFLEDLARVHTKADQELGDAALKPIQAKITELVEKGESGLIDGRAAYNIKRDLDRLGRSNDPNAWHALELKGVLMDALNRSLGPEKAAAFAQTRQQYGNMLALEKMAPNGAEGELSAARLANMRNIGNDELQELADIAAQFVKPREGAHGAAQRVFGAAGVGGVGAMVGGPVGAMLGVGGSMAAGRAANAALNSNAARNAVLGAAQSAEPAAMGALTGPATRALPVAGVAAMASQPDPIAQIGNATTVDEAINAATAAVSQPMNLPAMPAAAPVAPAEQPAPQPIAGPPAAPERNLTPEQQSGQEPARVWHGRRGDGYIGEGDAQMALRTRQKAEGDLDWRVEAGAGGRYRLAGYVRQEEVSAQAAPAAEMNASGTAMIRDPDGNIRKMLAGAGIQFLPMSDGRLLVGTRQAREAFGLLGAPQR